MWIFFLNFLRLIYDISRNVVFRRAVNVRICHCISIRRQHVGFGRDFARLVCRRSRCIEFKCFCEFCVLSKFVHRVIVDAERVDVFVIVVPDAQLERIGNRRRQESRLFSEFLYVNDFIISVGIFYIDDISDFRDLRLVNVLHVRIRKLRRLVEMLDRALAGYNFRKNHTLKFVLPLHCRDRFGIHFQQESAFYVFQRIFAIQSVFFSIDVF